MKTIIRGGHGSYAHQLHPARPIQQRLALRGWLIPLLVRDRLLVVRFLALVVILNCLSSLIFLIITTKLMRLKGFKLVRLSLMSHLVLQLLLCTCLPVSLPIPLTPIRVWNLLGLVMVCPPKFMDNLRASPGLSCLILLLEGIR
jgi:hypothetical protein